MASPVIVVSPVPTAPTSRIRRKAQVTYQSPSPSDSQAPSPLTILVVPQKGSTPPTLLSSTVTPATTRVTRRTALSLVPSRPQYLLDPALPLYHPLGRLARSLPELDAEKYGLPVPPRLRNTEISVDDDQRITSNGNGKRPARSRKPAAKVRDGEADEDGAGKGEEGERISDEGKMMNVEIREKEKPTPRRRRNGGSKRKRKDADDGDSAYPAKRARNPRGGHHAQTNAQEDEGGAEATGDATLDEKTVTERRTTRARANGAKRRDSSASSDAPGLRSGSKEKLAENSKGSSEGEQDESEAKRPKANENDEENEDKAC